MMMLVCLLRQKFKKLRFQMIDDTFGKRYSCIPSGMQKVQNPSAFLRTGLRNWGGAKRILA
jgi:hypothetical protein